VRQVSNAFTRAIPATVLLALSIAVPASALSQNVTGANSTTNPPATDLKQQMARKVLTALNPTAVRSSTGGDPKQRAHAMAPYFLRKLDPGNPDWNSRNPKWPAMQALVESNLIDDISEKTVVNMPGIEAAFVRAYADNILDADLQQLSAYLATAEGKQYGAFQSQIDAVYSEGMRALQASQPAPQQEPVSDDVRKRRIQILSLSNPTMIARAMYAAADSQHGDTSGFSAMPIMMQAVSTFEGPELDDLATRYAKQLTGFESFSQTTTAKNHFAAMAAAAAAVAPMATSEFTNFANTTEAEHMPQWQQAYQEKSR